MSSKVKLMRVLTHQQTASELLNLHRLVNVIKKSVHLKQQSADLISFLQP